MPFHGLASSVVLSALREGRQDGLFVRTVPGRVEVDGLLAGHRRAACEPWGGGTIASLLLGDGGRGEASDEAAILSLGAKSLGRAKLWSQHSADVASPPPKGHARHPFWHFEGDQLRSWQVLLCCFVLIFAGILCAAGGIGGGGIYVTLLMVAGGLDVVDAVPLSKAVVFLGSVPSLILNMRKSMGSSTKTLIDYNICRLVVPSSLLGTFLGVFLNRVLPSWVVLLVLSLILICMTVMVTRTTIQQYLEEECDAETKAKEAEATRLHLPVTQRSTTLVTLPGSGAAGVEGAGSPMADVEVMRSDDAASVSGGAESPASAWDSKTRNRLSLRDGLVSLFMLVIVVLSGVLRYHGGQCKAATSEARMHEVCHHPLVVILGYNTLQAWMHQEATASALLSLSIAVPSVFCSAVAMCYSVSLVRSEGWEVGAVLSYDLMAIMTGCLAGLVGIGGGLVFSPFFLLMSVDPAIAVATSSTCVIFTSSSTTLQYLFTDRVIMSLAAIYGLTNILASFAGTKFVHFLMDDFNARRSYISAIVGLGVAISAVLSLVKLGTSAASGSAAAH